MKYLIFAILCFIAPHMQGQRDSSIKQFKDKMLDVAKESPCKILSDETDPFTKNRTIITESSIVNLLSGGAMTKLSLCRAELNIGDIFYMVIVDMEDIDKPVCMNAGSLIYFLFEDDHVFTGSKIGPACSKESGRLNKGRFIYLVSADNLRSGIERHLKAIRISTDTGNIDINIVGGEVSISPSTTFFGQNAKCVLVE